MTLQMRPVDRQAAAAKLAQLGFPSLKFEPWRYSPIAKYADRDWGADAEGASALSTLVIDQNAEQNAFIQMNLARAAAVHGEVREGVLVQKVDQQHQHLAVEVAAGETKLVVQHYDAQAAPSTDMFEATVGEGGKLVRLQLRRNLGVHVGHTAVEIAKDANFTNIDVCFGGELARNELQVKLADTGATCDLLGTYLLKDSEHADTISYIDHAAPDTLSREVYKGVVTDNAHGVFQGQIHVAPDSQRIEGHQLSRGLILSDSARIDVKPELEIFADDVVCSHGATIGDLDEGQLFYLRARGIDQATARGMLIKAFVAEIIEEIPEAMADQEQLLAEVERWLN